MKFQKLTIHNIASIEDATINFEAEPLASSEVFLITGKTGAGKSTILDAICLALYATTPRLSNTKMDGKTEDMGKALTLEDPCQLLRKNTGEAFVTLTFVGNNSVHYEAEWSVARARGKVTGKMQSKKWRLQNIDTEYVIEKDNEIKAEMAKALGLDFNQFCRTTMLAQGEFTRFLNSDDKEKAEILEKITGVDVYSKLGAKIYELTEQKESIWKQFQQKIENTSTLSDEEVEAKKAELAALDKEYESLQVRYKNEEKRKQLLQTITEGGQKIEGWQADIKKDNDLIEKGLRPQAEKDKASVAKAAAILEELKTEAAEKDKEVTALDLPRLRDRQKTAATRIFNINLAKDRLDVFKSAQEKRQLTQQELAKAKVVINNKKNALPELELKLPEAKGAMDASEELYNKQAASIDDYATNIRAKLTIGDVCPVCQQKILTALPVEAELKKIVDTLHDAFLKAKNEYDILFKKKTKLEAEIRAEEKKYNADKEKFDNDKSVALAEAKVLEICKICGIEKIDDLTLSLLDISYKRAQTEEAELTGRIKDGERLEKELKERQSALNKQHTTIEALQRAAQESEKKITACMGRIETTKSLIQSKTDEIATAQKAVEQIVTSVSLTTDQQPAAAPTEKELKELGQKQGAIREQLKADSDKREQLRLLSAAAERAKADYDKWQRLNNLIGDKTGAKFRRIAQSYILATLIRAANKYMATLTDRYTLKVAAGTFVISIEDAYQGYVSRAASTISGGESFLVSLSLALALSDIGGRQVSADTLFIDEGFGTLSGGPFQNAIDTLKALHNSAGRHVGIISHVEELQERIPVQIQVNQEGNASSSTIKIIPFC